MYHIPDIYCDSYGNDRLLRARNNQATVSVQASYNLDADQNVELNETDDFLMLLKEGTSLLMFFDLFSHKC